MGKIEERVRAEKRWQPLKRAVQATASPELIADYLRATGGDPDKVMQALKWDEENNEYWINDVYQVQVRKFPDNGIHLNIRRRDGRPILRDWRHFQAIKNQLIGEECEAVELYPAESRKVDTSNKYHLYGVTDPAYRFPFGFTKRDVTYDDGNAPGTRQREETI